MHDRVVGMPPGELLGAHRQMRPLLLKPPGVRTVQLLLLIGGQLALEAAWMREVEDDQGVGQLRVCHGDLPGDESAPVVPDDDPHSVSHAIAATSSS